MGNVQGMDHQTDRRYIADEPVDGQDLQGEGIRETSSRVRVAGTDAGWTQDLSVWTVRGEPFYQDESDEASLGSRCAARGGEGHALGWLP